MADNRKVTHNQFFDAVLNNIIDNNDISSDFSRDELKIKQTADEITQKIKENAALKDAFQKAEAKLLKDFFKASDRARGVAKISAENYSKIIDTIHDIVTAPKTSALLTYANKIEEHTVSVIRNFDKAVVAKKEQEKAIEKLKKEQAARDAQLDKALEGIFSKRTKTITQKIQDTSEEYNAIQKSIMNDLSGFKFKTPLSNSERRLKELRSNKEKNRAERSLAAQAIWNKRKTIKERLKGTQPYRFDEMHQKPTSYTFGSVYTGKTYKVSGGYKTRVAKSSTGGIIPEDSEYGSINGSAGTNTPSQSDVIKNLQNQKEDATFGKVKPKGKKGDNNGNSFNAQQRKTYERQKQREFLALLIPALQKILNKSPIMDLIKFLFLMLGKKHPVLAAAGLTMGLPLISGLISNKLLGSPLKLGGLITKTLFGPATLRIFQRAGLHMRHAMRGGISSLLKAFKSLPDALKNAANSLKNTSHLKGGSKSIFSRLNPKNIKLRPINFADLRESTSNVAKAAWGRIKGATARGWDVSKSVWTNGKSGTYLMKNARNAQMTIGATKGILKRIPIAGALMTGAFELPDLLRAKKEGRLKRQAVTSGLKVTGSLGGSLLVGKAGAALGGALGSLAGPVGAAVGAVLGGIVGAIAGGIFGEKAAVKIDKTLDVVCGIFRKFHDNLKKWFPKLFGDSEQKKAAQQRDVMKEARKEAKMSAEKARDLQNKESKYIDILEKGDEKDWKVKGLKKRLAKEYEEKHNGEKITDDKLAELYKAEIQKHKDKKAEYAEEEKLALEKQKTAESMIKALDTKIDEKSGKVDFSSYGAVDPNAQRKLLAGKQVVAMSSLGLSGDIWDQNSKPYVPLDNVGKVRYLDKYVNSKGHSVIYTSNMGGHAEGTGHAKGNKIDFQTTNKVLTPDEYEHLFKLGYFGGNTGAIGYEHDHKTDKATTPEEYRALYKKGLVKMGGSAGNHYDFNIGSASEINKTVAKQTAAATTAATTSDTERPGVVSGSDIWDALVAHTGGQGDKAHEKSARNLVLSATDITGSLGVFGITQWNNSGARRGA